MQEESKHKIKLISEYFHPEPASTAQLMTQLAVGLDDRGYDVEAYTTQPTYQGQEKEKLPKKGEYQGVDINRVFSTKLDKEKFFLRAVNWLTFCLSLLFRFLFTREKSNVTLLAVSNPPIVHFFAGLVARIKGWNLVLITYDVYPDLPIVLGMLSENSLVTKIWNWMNRVAYNSADKIVALDQNMKENISSKTGCDIEDKITIIPNWEDPDFITPVEKSENSFAQKNGHLDDLTFIYSGNLGLQHDLESLVEAFDRVRELPVKMVFIGEGAKKSKVQKMVKEKDLENVNFHPYQPWEEVPITLTSGDVSVIAEDHRMEGICVSCKIYSSLATGQPILGITQETSEIAKVIENSDSGLYAGQGDVDQIVSHIKFWLNNPDELKRMGNNARNYFEQNFTVDRAVNAYANVIDSVMENS